MSMKIPKRPLETVMSPYFPTISPFSLLILKELPLNGQIPERCVQIPERPPTPTQSLIFWPILPR